MTDTNDKKLLKKKRIIAVISLIIVLVLAGLLTYFFGVKFGQVATTGVEFDEYIKSFGYFGWLVAVGIQILQVVIALIPGEVVEIGMGYAYGWLWGTLLCMLGVAIGSSAIFLLVKKYGIRFVELFVDADKINQLKFINSEKKLKRTTFILFFIPGTPKDLLTYFIGLTRMNLGEFLCITLIARIPSVVSSTIGGNFMGSKQYLEAIILFVVTGIVSLAGLKIYSVIIARKKLRASKNAHTTQGKNIS